MQNQLSFKARVIKGAGKGALLGFPTINLDLSDVPGELEYGVYAAYITIDGERHPAAMQYGSRPVLNMPKSCELHVIDKILGEQKGIVKVEVVRRLRDVRGFDSVKKLKEQIGKDVESVRRMSEE